jgi:hypothetical protein
MKMNSTQIDKTLHQLDAKAIPGEHPMMAKLKPLFGDHTYFLDGKGLNIVEPIEADQNDGRRGVVVNLADWTDEKTLLPHAPQPTELVVDLETDDCR